MDAARMQNAFRKAAGFCKCRKKQFLRPGRTQGCHKIPSLHKVNNKSYYGATDALFAVLRPLTLESVAGDLLLAGFEPKYSLSTSKHCASPTLLLPSPWHPPTPNPLIRSLVHSITRCPLLEKAGQSDEPSIHLVGCEMAPSGD